MTDFKALANLNGHEPTCVFCDQPIHADGAVRVRGGFGHENCAEAHESYETTDHGDSIWPLRLEIRALQEQLASKEREGTK